LRENNSVSRQDRQARQEELGFCRKEGTVAKYVKLSQRGRRDRETRRQGDKEIRRQEDRGTRSGGAEERRGRGAERWGEELQGDGGSIMRECGSG
jgi:hypothetical protein